ncbi:MAG: hypothetical protein QCH96_05615 [Candidatus Thermoplasmatota archaeon]|nr:hypothetical protein [Candidatus Thermoplasmatota archaeon]
MNRIANEDGPTAIEKIISVFVFKSTFRTNRYSLMQYIHEDKNAHLHLKFERRLPTMTIEPLTKIIKQGITEGVFKTKYPMEAAQAFTGISAMLLQGIYHTDTNNKDIDNKFRATFDFLEKILCADKDTLIDEYKRKGGKQH